VVAAIATLPEDACAPQRLRRGGSHRLYRARALARFRVLWL